ncbi:MAG TPA: bifunctional 4-hydroxy-2-oxoglutarate aldolase/2-dehydro-3-deoxy-phosphogluconate aldolase [Thermoanaerobaculia bacterium]|nr:bifunctional 4-hydroxy-2-oxoglutarate aldolase/2-dehydro-3-deoxy-phosphogluconate aldolase [Thermoanaerobaculia bacterium]
MATELANRTSIAASLSRSPVIGVVRTHAADEAAAQARTLADAGLELIEITFTVPDAAALVRELIGGRRGSGPPWFGMGTVTTAARARQALAAGAEFFVTPNVEPEVAREARRAEIFLIMGALTPSEIVAAREMGADLVKVYPLPPVSGPAYLATIRGPLGDVPMLAAGGFGVEEIPAYRQAGAVAFGLAYSLLLGGAREGGGAESRRRIAHAVALATGNPEAAHTVAAAAAPAVASALGFPGSHGPGSHGDLGNPGSLGDPGDLGSKSEEAR